MKPFRSQWQLRNQHGQTMVIFVIFLVVLVLFVGLGIDLGFAYITKAQLAKALDAAALAGVRNLYQPNAQVTTIVQSTFAMNYGRPGRDAGPVVPTVNFVTDPVTGNRQVAVAAAATINTYFIRLLPMWRTLTVRANAQALRGRLIMSIILDRSGSMANNGGWSALPPAVDTFVDCFDDTIDRAALVTFASNDRVDFAMGQPFRSQIKALVPRQQSQYSGATFMHGGLLDGYTQIINTPIQPGENVTRIAVFFTDGLANVIQDGLRWCVATNTLNYGGLDSGTAVGFFDPTTGACVGSKGGSISGCPSDPCSGTTTFISQIDGSAKTFTRANVTADAQYRTLATAQAMQVNGITVYAVGYGSGVDANFLRQLANDPASSAFNPGLPSGLALIAPTQQQLQDAFRTIASEVLARLTQ